MNETRKALYDEWRETYKNDPAKAVGWRNQEALDKRFDCTLSHLSHKEFDSLSILDVGCGASLNLLRYLPPHDREWNDYKYTGIDCNKNSLLEASMKYNIPFNLYYDAESPYQLIEDEYLCKVQVSKFDIIIAQGIHQEFDSVADVKKHIKSLSELLAPGGELLIMTPSNRLLDAEGKSVLKLSAHDAVSILEDVGLPYELFLGELGEHIIMRMYKNIV